MLRDMDKRPRRDIKERVIDRKDKLRRDNEESMRENETERDFKRH